MTTVHDRRQVNADTRTPAAWMHGLLGLVWLVSCAGSVSQPAHLPSSPPTVAPLSAGHTRGGMWMPEQMPVFSRELAALRLAIDPASLADPTKPPLSAVVSLGGCSASFVSAQGLVITNHHCVTGALQFNSTAKQNLIEQGFVASSLQEERWAGPTARIFVTRHLADVTSDVLQDMASISDPAARKQRIDTRCKALVAACEKERPELRCEVRAFDEGARFVRVEMLEIKDVRLVYAPHEGIGVFGGDIDNWRWPRHTGDFAFLRAYVGPNGLPAEHHANNVPYQPPHHLQIAAEPLRKGDFVMVAGYPGSTYRHHLADEVQNRVQWFYPHLIDMLQSYLGTLEVAAADTGLRIKAASRLQGLSNSLINARGTLEGLKEGALVQEKRRLEAKLQACIAKDPQLKKKYGQVLPALRVLQKQLETEQKKDRAVSELLRGSMLLDAALVIVRLAEERRKPNAHRENGYQLRDEPRITQRLQSLSASYDERLDRPVLRLFVQRAMALPPEHQPHEALRILAQSQGDSSSTVSVEKLLLHLYGGTTLGDETARVRWVATRNSKQVKDSTDSFISLARKLLPLRLALERKEKRREGQEALLRPLYMQALRTCAEGPVASDANGTLRITFGTVNGYRPRPQAPVFSPFTILPEMLAKHTGQPPFALPLNLRKAAEAFTSHHPYADASLGALPVNFLADLDITGGNSGSATLNRNGHLVGLAFDGNYESIASDWVFLPEITRSIHVDIRFVLWVMDAVDGAHRLLREMGVMAEPAPPGAH